MDLLEHMRCGHTMDLHTVDSTYAETVHNITLFHNIIILRESFYHTGLISSQLYT